MSKEKITVTIEEELVRELDREAKSIHGSRSNLVENAIRTWKRIRLEQELKEGYRNMADEDLKVAEENLTSGYEVIK
ncbi:MAG: ribbon-helix-helix domain-containing protein [Acidobacteriia bacterium]|nr:ribbon-helix-helix domain-containing protein [Terriglobia bacterium]